MNTVDIRTAGEILCLIAHWLEKADSPPATGTWFESWNVQHARERAESLLGLLGNNDEPIVAAKASAIGILQIVRRILQRWLHRDPPLLPDSSELRGYGEELQKESGWFTAALQSNRVGEAIDKDSTVVDCWFSEKQLADKHSVGRTALRGRLERWRKKTASDDGWRELSNTKKGEAKIVYKEGAVIEIIRELKSP